MPKLKNNAISPLLDDLRMMKLCQKCKKIPHNPKVVSSNLAPATRNSYLKDNCEQEKHVVSVLYRGCVLFYCLFCGTHRMTEICLVPLPYPYRFSVRVFFELLRERKCLKNALLSAVFKKFTNRKGYTNICSVYPFLSHS